MLRKTIFMEGARRRRFLGGLKAIFERHGQRQDYDIWCEIANLQKGLCAVGSLSADFPVAFVSDQGPHTHAKDFTLIHD